MTLLPTRSSTPHIESLEARIAPAVIIANPLPDLVVGGGKTGTTIDLSTLVSAGYPTPYRTVIEFVTNIDTDPNTAGVQAGVIQILLYDDVAPLTVQNFLNYLTNLNTKGDYDNTIIHRVANLDGTGGNDIIQGGGFEITPTSTAHIVTGNTVHNEYSLPNVRGTISLAKTGQGAHTGTSEWFINTSDNSTTLGPSNGNSQGYTVFGEVISGMNYVDYIAGLTTYKFNSPFGELPLHNGYTDPDNNPTNGGPTPTMDQFVKIVDARVVSESVPAPAKLKYTIEITDPLNLNKKSTVVTAAAPTANGILNLKYAAGKWGIADVKVTVSNPDVPSDFVTDTFRVDVRPNLIANITSEGLFYTLAPGEKSTMQVAISNTGGGQAIGTVSVKADLVKYVLVDTNSDGVGDTLEVDPDTAPRNLGESTYSLNLATGKSQTVKLPIAVPSILAEQNGEYWQVVVSVETEGGAINGSFTLDGATQTVERFTDDNDPVNGTTHQLYNFFGDIFSSDLGLTNTDNAYYVRTVPSITYLDVDSAGNSKPVTLSIKGGGLGLVNTDSDGRVQLLVSRTSLATTLSGSLPVGSGHGILDEVELYSPIGTVGFGQFDVKGPFSAMNGLKTLTLGDLSGQWMMLIGNNPYDSVTKATLTLGSVKDYSILSLMPIASLTALEWIDANPGSIDSISTPALGILKITGNASVRGDFEADLTLSESSVVSSITIAGLLKDSNIRAYGNIGSVTVGGMLNSTILAGVNSIPDATSDFTDPLSIGAFTIKGIKNYQGDYLFADSIVSAHTLGTIKLLGTFDTTSDRGDIGFFADVIKSYNRVTSGGTIVASNVTAARDIEVLNDFLVRVL